MISRRTVETYPVEVSKALGWSTGVGPLLMLPLEFDILARSFADGLSRALSDLFGVMVVVGVRLRCGLLETVKVPGRPERRSSRLGYSFDYLADWRQRVQPIVERHIDFMRAAGRVPVGPASMASILSDAMRRMTEVTYLHHTLVLPARLKLVEFAEFARGHDLVSTTTEALCLLAGRENATTAIAEQLWLSRYQVGKLPDIAQEGDGYGLACPNWLEDSAVAALLCQLYRALDEIARPSTLLSAARLRGARLRVNAHRALRDKSAEVRAEFDHLWNEASAATQITEDHAPLMHARLPHELRALTLRIGEMLTAVDQLDQLEDIFHLYLDELASCQPDDRRWLRDCVASRRLAVGQARRRLQDEARPEDCYGQSTAAELFRRLFQSADPVHTPGALRGHPASPGRGRGRIRRLARQRDIETVRVHDVLVTPDSASGWSYALPVATAVVAESGHSYGYLASLARDFAKPAVIGVGDTSGILRDGWFAEVDGAAGEVRLISDNTWRSGGR